MQKKIKLKIKIKINKIRSRRFKWMPKKNDPEVEETLYLLKQKD